MKTVDFEPPKNSLPEGVKTGDEFELVCTFRLKESGSVCLTQFGDAEMEDDKDDSKPNYADHVSDMKSMMTSKEAPQE